MQQGYGLLLGGHSLFQLGDVLLFAVLILLQELDAFQQGAEERLVRQLFQRVVAVAHHQLHPGGVLAQALQPVVGVIAEEEGGVPLQIGAVGGLPDDAVVGEQELGHAAGQLARIEAELLGRHRQLKRSRHGPGQLVGGAVGGGQRILFGKAEACIVIEQRLQQGGRVGAHFPLGVGGGTGLHLLFQRKAPLGQPGNALVRELELLFEVRDSALQGRRGGRSFVGHDWILLIIIYFTSAGKTRKKISVLPHTAGAVLPGSWLPRCAGISDPSSGAAAHRTAAPTPWRG